MRPVRIAASAALAKLNPRPPAPAGDPGFVQAVDLPVGQKIALLKLRRGEVAGAILGHLRAMSAPDPEKADWRALIAEGRIARVDGALRLTPAGMWVASAILRDYARRFGVHAVSLRTAYRPHASCTCGWAQGDHATRNGHGNVQSAAYFHAQATGGFIQ